MLAAACRGCIGIVAFGLTLCTAALSQAPTASANPLSASTRGMYAQVRANIVASSTTMPDSNFNFRPTAEVRTFGQLLAHIANAEFTICAAAQGRPNPHPGNLEERSWSPSELRTLVRDAFTLCDGAYAELRDELLAGEMDFFGTSRSRHFAMTYNLLHANEHYGNIVTYLRIKGHVPPSTAPPTRP